MLSWLLRGLIDQLEGLENNILSADIRSEGMRDRVIEWQAKRVLIVGLLDELVEIRRGDQGNESGRN